MSKPSPYAHLTRLAALLILGGIAFAIVREAMIPASWSPTEGYRTASLTELAEQPMRYGENKSCYGCHEEDGGKHKRAVMTMRAGSHRGLSCESCHGPIGHHVQDDHKVAQARIDYSRLACLNCHANLITHPAKHMQFIHAATELTPRRETELTEHAKQQGKSKLKRHKRSVHPHMDCVQCHESFHDPET